MICKHYQNIIIKLMFMTVFGIHCTFFIVLPIRLKNCISNGFSFIMANVPPEKSGASQIWARNLSRSGKGSIHNTPGVVFQKISSK